jgi:hypothetical protein
MNRPCAGVSSLTAPLLPTSSRQLDAPDGSWEAGRAEQELAVAAAGHEGEALPVIAQPVEAVAEMADELF